MSKKSKSRRAVKLYYFGDEKPVNLNGYIAKCNVTGEEKRFYHSYLGNLIETKYNNSLELFESTYVSRAGQTVNSAVTKAAQLEERISALYSKIRDLKAKRDELQPVS